MKIGFIGGGNMASAIISGAVSSGAFEAADISVFDTDAKKGAALSKAYGVHACESVQQLIALSDAVVLAVKPNVFPKLLPSVSGALKEKNSLILSIAAGKTIAFIEGLLGYEAAVIRIMPNINAMALAAMSAYCFNDKVTDVQKAFAEKLCASFGKVMCLDESFFPLFGVIAGAAPAYSYMFIDALARAGVKNGMTKQVALEIAAQTVLGSAEMIAQSKEHPWALVDKVCSPGGTTIEGVASLQRDGLEAAIANAVDAALDKDKRI